MIKITGDSVVKKLSGRIYLPASMNNSNINST